MTQHTFRSGKKKKKERVTYLIYSFPALFLRVYAHISVYARAHMRILTPMYACACTSILVRMYARA